MGDKPAGNGGSEDDYCHFTVKYTNTVITLQQYRWKSQWYLCILMDIYIIILLLAYSVTVNTL